MSRRIVYGTETRTSLSFSWKEIVYLLFKKKDCPKCGGKMKKRLEMPTDYSLRTETRSPLFKDGVKVKEKEYTSHFLCPICQSRFPLAVLANAREN